MPVLIVYCSCPDASSAGEIARSLVEERLAACVSEVPGMRSTWRWQDKIEQGQEHLLLIKTTEDRLEALTRRVAQLHPYELPEVIAVAATGGLVPYLAWVAEQTVAHD